MRESRFIFDRSTAEASRSEITLALPKTTEVCALGTQPLKLKQRADVQEDRTGMFVHTYVVTESIKYIVH